MINNRENWWVTPIIDFTLDNAPDINASLVRIIKQEEKKLREANTSAREIAGVKQGLTAQWMNYNVLLWDYPEVRILRDFFTASVCHYISRIGEDPEADENQILGMSVWANILRHGESLALHHHDPGFVSAHFTVKAGIDYDNIDALGVPKDSGHTVYYKPGFLDRMGEVLDTNVSPWDKDWKFSERPKEGNLRIFPSHVRHEVRPYLGGEERISIAMDVYIKKQNPLIYFEPPRWYVPEPVKKENAGVIEMVLD